MTDWNISKPLGQCSGTGQAIGPGQDFVAALVETQEGFERRDYSMDYWDRHQPEVYCFWKTRMPKEDEENKQVFVDDQMLETFFDRLGHESDQEKLELRFVVALVLMRKRRLKYESSQLEGDREVWVVRKTNSKERVEVVNPGLDESRIEALTGQIGQILQAEL